MSEPDDGMTHRPQVGSALATWLRAVFWGAALVPLAAFVTTALWGFDRAKEDAENAVSKASMLALQHAERSLAVARKVAQRADIAAGGDDASVRSREKEIHDRLADIAAGLPSVVNLNIWDAEGHPLVRSDIHPVGAATGVGDRAYFVEQKAGDVPLGISEVLVGRNTGRELFNATIRRTGANGRFAGVVAVSLSPEFFREYYRTLASEEPELASFALVRTDGSIIARWPRITDGRRTINPEGEVFRQIRQNSPSGIVTVPRFGDRESRIVSYRRVPGVPLYVTAGVSRSAMFVNWLRFCGVLALFFVPITLGLLWVTWIALRKTRREQRLAAAMQEQIRHRARAERAVLETQKLQVLSQLTGGVAHDFNNLLTVISNNLHILARRHPTLDTERPFSSMSRAVQSGVRLTRQLLSFSRKQALVPEVVDLARWLPATEGLIRSTLGSRITLAFEVAPDTAPITVDLAELELALLNTAINAQHAMPEGGSLRITASNAGPGESAARPMVVIRIQDSGVGIPPELIERVFEPFFTTREIGKGSGLGLSQVHGLCEQAGGFATVASTVGQGTTIAMFLPATVTRPASVVEMPAVEEALAGQVLLVEDNDDVAFVTAQVMREAGLSVARVSNADDALARLARDHERFDVVLSDISMPGTVDGIELALAVRRAWPALPVILVTGYAERIHDAVGAGLRVLSKPVAPDDILREIGHCLRHRTARV